MEKAAALEQIKKSCHAISLELMRLHPANNVLDPEIKDEVYKALFELTKQVETIKKLARKAESKLSNDPASGELPPVL